MSDWRITFGENLKHLRRVHGLTQVEMAKVICVCVHTYRKMERGCPTVRIGSGRIRRICDYFDITSDEMLGKQEMTQ